MGSSYVGKHYSEFVPPDILYHYTTSAGLLGILKPGENSLWASALGFSNDTSEGRYATNLGLEVLDDYQSLPGDPKEWSEVLPDIRSWFTSTSKHRESAYAVCFCEEDDLLSQWRAYGGIASFSIGFSDLMKDTADVAPLREGFSSLDLVKIEYDVVKQKLSLIERLKNMKSILDGIEIQSPGDPPEPDCRKTALTLEQRRSEAKEYLYSTATRWAHCVKHEAFNEEKEWRIITYPYENYYPESLIQKSIALRENRGRLLPYVSIVPQFGRFSVRSVTVGPCKTQGLEVKAVKLLLAKAGFTDVEVIASEIPLQS